MISFVWNNVCFNICALGSGILKEKIAGHEHSKNSYELHFITGGKGKLITEDKTYNLKKGDFFVTGPNFYHAHETNDESPLEDIYVYLQKVGEKKTNAFSSAFLSKQFYFTEKFDYSSASMLVEENNKRLPDYKSAAAGLAMKLMTDIVRCYLPEEFSEKSENDNLYDKRFIIIEKYFLYSNDLTLSGLSEEIGLCTRQTERLLKKYYGKSFREKKRERNNSDE